MKAEVYGHTKELPSSHESGIRQFAKVMKR